MIGANRAIGMLGLLTALFFTACTSRQQTPVGAFPEWAKDAVVYQVNVQDFTPEGTFKALELHLPRLQNLGVEMLWLSPVFPVGDNPRANFYGPQSLMTSHDGVNPAYGTDEDFRALVRAAQGKGMRVMLTWEAQCASSEHPLVVEHPEWFLGEDSLQAKGLALFDLSVPEVIQFQVQRMQHWVQSFEVDGFYFQHAGQLPPDFWTAYRDGVAKMKPLLTIADVLTDANRSFLHVADENQVLVTARNALEGKLLRKTLAQQFQAASTVPYSLNYTSSMLINARQGTVFERLGASAKLWAAYTQLKPGMPMVYSGQEVGLKVSLSESEKDTIAWGDHPFNSFYDRLHKLRKDHPALWLTAEKSVTLMRTSADDQVIAYLHSSGNNHVLGVFNFTDKSVDFKLLDSFPSGRYKSFNSRASISLEQQDTLQLGPYGFEIYTLKP
ncbi:alpha-amylase family glycosyl hydrolase [Marinoscillum furvescens]|uniref:Maltogenic amylase n=1 Tax=Marinoscillum furvescens DSM 4134 TaxID=1122208 RepID=A0A3D9L1D7_MARFU|nr:alpha-amylase family glycosyl hydrolase [Marinoscillum furvescens]RED97868.1 maltogenic amylase [Marinoscillum furvescens DSM 4134]